MTKSETPEPRFRLEDGVIHDSMTGMIAPFQNPKTAADAFNMLSNGEASKDDLKWIRCPN